MILFKTLYSGNKENVSAKRMNMIKDFENNNLENFSSNLKEEHFDLIWLNCPEHKMQKYIKLLSDFTRKLPDEKGRKFNDPLYRGKSQPALFVLESPKSYYCNFFDLDHLESNLNPSEAACKHLLNIAIQKLVADLPYASFYDLSKRIAKNVAQKYFLDHQDLLACAWETFEKGKTSYNPSGGSFTSWLGKRMKFRMIDYLRAIRQPGTRRPDKKGYNVAPVLFASFSDASKEVIDALNSEAEKQDIKNQIREDSCFKSFKI